MKKNFILIFGFTVAISHAQINARDTSPEYDSALAKKLEQIPRSCYSGWNSCC